MAWLGFLVALAIYLASLSQKSLLPEWGLLVHPLCVVTALFSSGMQGWTRLTWESCGLVAKTLSGLAVALAMVTFSFSANRQQPVPDWLMYRYFAVIWMPVFLLCTGVSSPKSEQ